MAVVRMAECLHIRLHKVVVSLADPFLASLTAQVLRPAEYQQISDH